ncbi:MAG TPA: hypothetical protein VFB79_14445 [Candidatus Angelobacter sp.]|nr:hypothetical protein [Candidatus Angelobacter sp.]
MAKTPPVTTEDLLVALESCGDQLKNWINNSQEHALAFAEDPASASNAPAPNLDANVMLELEKVLTGLARKLDLSVPVRDAA